MPTFLTGPVHILVYGTLLGTDLFNSFVGNVVAFRSLPRPQFAQLQTYLFPPYFAIQTILPVVLGLTYPARTVLTTSNYAILSSEARSDFYTLSLAAVTGVLNWGVIGPWTTNVMRLRKHQETRDGKKSYDPGPHSEEMKELNRRFGVLHGISSLANLVAMGAVVGYGIGLGRRLN